MLFRKMRTLKVPAEHAEKVCKLHDAIYAIPGLFQSQEARYNFWTFVEEILPETKNGKWQMRFDRAQSPKVKELR